MARDKMSTIVDLKGLDMVTPVDLIADGRTPYSKNFRLYAAQEDDRQVAVSSRKGPSIQATPLTEAVAYSNTSTTGASTVTIDTIGHKLIPFTATATARMTMVELNVADVDGNASGPLMIRLYSDKDGKPHHLLSESSILSGDIGDTHAWKGARYINAYELQNGDDYWLDIQIQDDGKNSYSLSTTTVGAHSYAADTVMYSATEQTYAINFRVYTSESALFKGSFRFNRDNGQNTTLVAYGQTMYRLDEAQKQYIPILSGLSSSATEYSFAVGDNKIFWVNGYDQLTNWDGTIEANATNMISNYGFDTNTTGWTATAGSTITRDTGAGNYHTSPAGLSVTAASGTRGASTSITMYANRRYKVTYWAKGASASGNTQFQVNGTTVVSASTTPITAAWAKYEMYYVPSADVTSLQIQSTAVNFYIDDIAVIDTGIEYIIDTELPILSYITFHKDRIFGKTAADPNKTVWSENPGNPAFDPTGLIATTARQQWYYAWLSVSYWYVPKPHNGSPLVASIPFQDSLIHFTQDNKYVFSGYSRGNFGLRQSTGSKGALSRKGVVNDENNIFFVSNDGIYQHNGSIDKKISKLITPMFNACPRKQEISLSLWKNQLRVYMSTSGSTENNICMIFDRDNGEWMLDTDTYVAGAVNYSDADDDDRLVEFSSQVQAAYIAEQAYNNLGGPIDFEYRFPYDSMKSPMQRKRIRRFYPILQGISETFKILLAMDKDFQDSPRIKEQMITHNGAKIGGFKIGDGTKIGGDTYFNPKRESFPGWARYWQLRVLRKGVNNRVAFSGAQFTYKLKKL